MTADAAHVAAVIGATAVHQHRGQGQRKWDGTGWMCRCGEWVTDWNRHRATVAVETLTPLIRAQVAAEIRARADDDGDWIGQTDPDSILRMAARIAEATP